MAHSRQISPIALILVLATVILTTASLATASTPPTLESDALEIKFVTDFDPVYADYGTGADANLSTWRPRVPPGFMRLGDYAHSSYDKPTKAIMMVVKPKQSNAIAYPTDYELIWGEWGSGGDQDGTFWHPRCPGNYVGLGSLANRSYSKPATTEMVCVRQDLTTLAKVGPRIWGDWGSGSDSDGTLYAIALATQSERGGQEMYVSSGSFTGHSSYNAMTSSPVARALKLTLNVETHSPELSYPPLTGLAPPAKETSPQLAARTYLPAIAVKDPAFQNAADRLRQSPIYVLERYDYYFLQDHKINDSDSPLPMSFSIKSGMTQTESKSFTETFGISVTTSAGAEGKVFSASVSVTVSYLTSKTAESSTSISRLEDRAATGTVPARGAGAWWSLAQRYELKRWNEGSSLDSWILIPSGGRFSTYEPKSSSHDQTPPPPSGPKPPPSSGLPPAPPSSNDSRSTTDDIIWQRNDGQIHYWKMDKGQLVSSADIYIPVGADWTLIDTGDVDGDGTDDILWQRNDGQVHYWPMKNGQRMGGRDIYIPVGEDWTLIGAGDMDGDGTDDVLWQRYDGQVHYWPMKNGQRQGGLNIDVPVPSDWVLIGAGDLDRDGTDDLLWINNLSGQVHYWQMKRGEKVGGFDIHDLSYPREWTLESIGDVNGNGTANPVWQRNDGQVGYWRINRGRYLGGAEIHTPVDSEWTLRAVGNVD